MEHTHSFRGGQVIPCFYNVTTSVFVDTPHFVMSSRGSVRIHGESFTIAVTDEFCPRQIGSSVDIYRRQAEQISTCNTCRSEAFNVGSHILRSNPSSVRVKVISTQSSRLSRKQNFEDPRFPLSWFLWPFCSTSVQVYLSLKPTKSTNWLIQVFELKSSFASVVITLS